MLILEGFGSNAMCIMENACLFVTNQLEIWIEKRDIQYIFSFFPSTFCEKNHW